MTTETRQCLECGDKLLGRADQKFCSDQCRNAYNNRHNSDQSKLMRNVNNVLRKNRRILDALCPDDKVKLSKDKLTSKGFNFKYITHLYETKAGTVYHFCYELGYLFLENDDVLIVRRSYEED